MRYDQTQGVTAADLINSLAKRSLVSIFVEYSGESLRTCKHVVNAIANRRQQRPFETTLDLADCMNRALSSGRHSAKTPCTGLFQALRIAVNSELDQLSQCLDTAFNCLNPGGRFVILTFHSLEDRMVKQKFAGYCQGCTCPPEFPVCVCGKKPRAKLINRKPIEADAEELAQNSRSKSAKLRILEKL